MNIDLKKIGDYWQVATIILSLVVSLTYFVIENKQANETIKELSKSNIELSEKVHKLEGHTDGFNHAIKMFMEHPPGLIEYRVDKLEKKIFGETDESDSHDRDRSVPPPVR